MSQISETADLEAEIEALIKRAGDRLRQTRDDLHRNHAPEQGQDQVSQQPPPEPVKRDVAGNSGSTFDCEV